MNTEKLSERLQAVVGFIPTGYRLADIGSDHAYLPCYAVKKGLVSFAIAGEVVEGPYQSARNQVMSENLTDKISVRKGSGLEVIQQGEVDCITIAGMGGALISQILEEGKDKLGDIKRLILQPNISAVSIRQWCLDNSWKLIDEKIILEDGKIYEILVAERGNPHSSYSNDNFAKELLMGPYLLKEKNNVFIKKWTDEKRNWGRIITQLKNATITEENVAKINELNRKINMVEEVLS